MKRQICTVFPSNVILASIDVRITEFQFARYPKEHTNLTYTRHREYPQPGMCSREIPRSPTMTLLFYTGHQLYKTLRVCSNQQDKLFSATTDDTLSSYESSQAEPYPIDEDSHLSSCILKRKCLRFYHCGTACLKARLIALRPTHLLPIVQPKANALPMRTEVPRTNQLLVMISEVTGPSL